MRIFAVAITLMYFGCWVVPMLGELGQPQEPHYDVFTVDTMIKVLAALLSAYVVGITARNAWHIGRKRAKQNPNCFLWHKWQNICRHSTQDFLGKSLHRDEYVSIQKCHKCGRYRQEYFCIVGITYNYLSDEQIKVIEDKLARGELYIPGN